MTNPWTDDFSFLLSPPSDSDLAANTFGPAPTFSHQGQLPSSWIASKDLQRQLQPLNLLAAFVAGAPNTILPGNTEPGSHQAWEAVENPEISGNSQNRPLNPPYPELVMPRNQTLASANRSATPDTLRFVAVDPLQLHALSQPQRRGTFQDRDRQEETSRTQGLRACVRCCMQKIRVRNISS